MYLYSSECLKYKINKRFMRRYASLHSKHDITKRRIKH